MPHMLPDRRGVLFAVDRGTGLDSVSIEMRPLPDGPRKVLARGAQTPRYVPGAGQRGHVLFNTRSTLFALPFDVAALEARGPAVPVLTDLAYTPTGVGQFDVSRTGSLVYIRAQPPRKTIVQWVDPTGRRQPLLAQPGGYRTVSLAPDGTRLALTTDDGAASDVWVYDTNRAALTRATTTGIHRAGGWTPDGRHIVLSALLGGIAQLRRDAATGPQPLTGGKASQYLGSVSPDGRWLVYVESLGMRQIRAVSIEDQGGLLKAGAPEPRSVATFNETRPIVSPDGRWLAYESDESGRIEIYVRPFPLTAGQQQRWVISSGGGVAPHWSRDGRRLVYQNGDQLMSAGYTVVGDAFAAETPRVWIDKLGAIDGPPGWGGSTWDLSPEGDRVAVVTPDGSQESVPDHHVVMMLNFADELRRRAPLPE